MIKDKKAGETRLEAEEEDEGEEEEGEVGEESRGRRGRLVVVSGRRRVVGRGRVSGGRRATSAEDVDDLRDARDIEGVVAEVDGSGGSGARAGDGLARDGRARNSGTGDSVTRAVSSAAVAAGGAKSGALIRGARISGAVGLSAVAREADVLDGDALSAAERVLALIDDGPGTVDDEVGRAGSGGGTSDRGVSVVLASNGLVRGEGDEHGLGGIGLEDGLGIRGSVTAEVSDGPGTDEGLGADTLVGVISVGDVETDAARRDSGGGSSDGGEDGGSALNGSVLRDSEDGGLRESEGDDLVTGVAVSTAITDGPGTDDLGGGGAVKTSVAVGGGDGRGLAVIDTSGGSSGGGGSGRAISAVAGDVLREGVERGLGGITDLDDLVLTGSVTAGISDGPGTGNRGVATSGHIAVSVSGLVDTRARVSSSGGSTSDGEVINVSLAVDGDGGGESNKDGGSAVLEGDELVALNKVTASILGSPGTGDGLVASRAISVISLGDGDRVAAIRGGGGSDGEGRSALENSVSGEAGVEGGGDCIRDSDGLSGGGNVTATVVGGEGTDDLLGASVDGGGDVSGSEGGGSSVASISGGGATERGDGGGGTALDTNVGGGVGEGRGDVIRDGDDLDGGDGGSAAIRDGEGAGDGLVARVSSGTVGEGHGEGSARVERSGGTEGGNGGGRTALEVDVGGSSRERRLDVVGDSDDLRASALVTAVIRGSEGAGEGLDAGGSSGTNIREGDVLGGVAVVSKDGGGDKVGGISGAVARNAGSSGEL